MRASLLSTLLVAATGCSTAAQAGTHGWAQASNIGRDVLFAAALGVPAVQQDWAGDLQAGGSILLAGGATYGLKEIFPEERPDHSDRKSFPSGHSAESFAAAASLENRYGWQAGLPAFAAATFVAVARVEARKHHWYDCVAGAAIGTGSGFLLTSKRDNRVKLVPWGDAGGGGLALVARF
jgi:membrane-associated phospholipid phosphatase